MPDLQAIDEAAKVEKLKAALWYAIGQSVDQVALTQNLNATPHFIGGLSEMVYGQLELVAKDLEAFAKHDGGREVIMAKDVLMLGRRNEGLAELLEREIAAAEKKK